MSTTNKVKVKKVDGISRYTVNVNGALYDIQKRDEKSPYGDIPWDIHLITADGWQWEQTFGSKARCVEYLQDLNDNCLA